MKKAITARHFDLHPDIKARAESEMDGLTKFFENITSADLVLEKARHRNIAELQISVARDRIVGSAEADDMMQAMLAAVDKVTTQLKKHKDKLKLKKPEEVQAMAESVTRPKANPEDVDM